MFEKKGREREGWSIYNARKEVKKNRGYLNHPKRGRTKGKKGTKLFISKKKKSFLIV